MQPLAEHIQPSAIGLDGARDDRGEDTRLCGAGEHGRAAPKIPSQAGRQLRVDVFTPLSAQGAVSGGGSFLDPLCGQEGRARRPLVGQGRGGDAEKLYISCVSRSGTVWKVEATHRRILFHNVKEARERVKEQL